MVGLSFDAAWPAGTCSRSLYGFLVGGGDTLVLNGSRIVAGGARPINGCNGGIALQIGMSWTTPSEVGHASLLHDRISGYQRGGIVVDGTGSSGIIVTTTVKGAGPTNLLAQTGIEVGHGAYGKIQQSTITANECNAAGCGANALSNLQAIGVRFNGAALGSRLVTSTIQKNDVGVSYGATSLTPLHFGDVGLSRNGIGANRYEDVLVGQGKLSMDNNLITGGTLGILLLQFQGQSYGPHLNSTNDRLFGSPTAAVKILSDLAIAGDFPGAFVANDDTLLGPILNNSTNVTVTIH